MYILDILDAATYRPTMAELTATLAELLATASAAQLQQPRYVTVSDATAQISLQFSNELDSVNAILSWASAFCAAVRSDTRPGDQGPEVWASTAFTYDNVSINAYARIEVPAEGPADPALSPVPGESGDGGA